MPKEHSIDARLVSNAPEHFTESRPFSKSSIRPLWLVEKEAIEQAITLCEGNIPQAAAALKISPSTIYRKKAGW